ncbi:MAG: glycosyltransferase [Flavobacteriaceae bacterium]
MIQQHVLIIGAVWVEPNASAAGSRMLQLIEQFLYQDWKITFASTASRNKNSLDLTKFSIDEVAIELNSNSFDVFIRELNPTMVVFDRFMTEEQFGWRVTEHCPNALRVLDTEDLHCLRKTRQEVLKKEEVFKVDDVLDSELAKREIAAILRSDLSLIISSYEMELLKSVFKIDDILLYHLPFMISPIMNENIDNWMSFEERKHFVFIGNFLHAPNVDTVLYLKNVLWKEIKKELPNAELHIYGAYPTQQILEMHNDYESFLIKGFAKNAHTVIQSAKVMLAPIRFGAGIKGKLVEAMINGTPSVASNIGAEGMSGDLNWSGFVEDDSKEFIRKAIRLYVEKEIWMSSQKKGVEIINSLYNKQPLGQNLIKKIESLQQVLPEHRKKNFIGSLLHHHTMKSTMYMSKWIAAKNKN